jgi:hypothetical protein
MSTAYPMLLAVSDRENLFHIKPSNSKGFAVMRVTYPEVGLGELCGVKQQDFNGRSVETIAVTAPKVFKS